MHGLTSSTNINSLRFSQPPILGSDKPDEEKKLPSTTTLPSIQAKPVTNLQELIPLVTAKPLEKIAYSDKPLPLLAKDAEIEELPPEQLAEKLGFTYTEGVYATNGIVNELKMYFEENQSDNDVPGYPTNAAILSRLENPLNDTFVVCNAGVAGNALFTKRRISAGEVLFLYAGIVKHANKYDLNNNYSIDTGIGAKGSFLIDSESAGNLSRCMSHLPIDLKERDKIIIEKMLQKDNIKVTEQVVEEYYEAFKELGYLNEMHGNLWDDFEGVTFDDPTVRKNIAKFNVYIRNTVINGVSLTICWAPDSIEADQQIGFSYSNFYWKNSHRNPLYFDQKGKIILPFNYHLSDELASFSTVPPKKLYNSAIDKFNSTNYNGAILDLLQTIINFKDSNRNTIPVANCYSTLASCFRETGDLETALLACKEAVRIYEMCKKDLTPKLRSKYNELLEQATQLV